TTSKSGLVTSWRRVPTRTKWSLAGVIFAVIVGIAAVVNSGGSTAVSATCQSDLTTAAHHPDDPNSVDSPTISSLVDCKSKDEWLAAAHKAYWSGSGGDNTTPEEYIDQVCSGLSYPACK